MGINRGCPNCNCSPLPEDDQDFPEDDTYTIQYACGGVIIYMVHGRYWEWKNECTIEDIYDGK